VAQIAMQGHPRSESTIR